MNQEQPYRPTREIATRLMSDILGESAGTLKLYFTVSTGALVLFINLIAGSHAPRSTMALLALSIFGFGGSSLLCLRLLVGLLKLRVMSTGAILSTKVSLSEMQGKIDV